MSFVVFAKCEVLLDIFAICEYTALGDPWGWQKKETMHVIARPALLEFARIHQDAKSWLNAWWKNTKKARWTKSADVRAAYPAADLVGICVVFNVRGNNYRLIVKVAYATEELGGIVLIRKVLTHAEYNDRKWKGACQCP